MNTTRTVTGLRSRGRGRIVVELDGAEWRSIPADVVVRADLAVGRQLDRPALRHLRCELRRAEALSVAARSLRARDQSVASLKRRLDRAAVAPAAQAEALAALKRSGVLDDARFAENRATALAERGYGDAAIRSDLERSGIESELRNRALASLRSEEERAREIVARRGAGARTARFLAGRGFAEDAVESALARVFAPDP